MSDLVAHYPGEDVIMALLGAGEQRRVSTRRTDSVERVDGGVSRKEFTASSYANRE